MRWNGSNEKHKAIRQCKTFRRDRGIAQGYVVPIIEDAFAFRGPEIDKKRIQFYLKSLSWLK